MGERRKAAMDAMERLLQAEVAAVATRSTREGRVPLSRAQACAPQTFRKLRMYQSLDWCLPIALTATTAM